VWNPLDVLLPQLCLACGRPGALYCASCRSGVHRLTGPLCARCGAPTAWPVARCRECAGRRLAFAHARSAVAYDGATRAVVRGWKDRGLRRVGPVAADLVVEILERPSAGVLTWVPPVRDRVLLRGHSTAEQLARELARRWQLEPASLLARTRFASAQRGQDLAGRRRNVSGAFRASGPAPARVCLVDDVYTTGATVSAAATALRKAGSREVTVVTLARTLRRLD
jgi:predicted amidophosphoribosyltransferase